MKNTNTLLFFLLLLLGFALNAQKVDLSLRFNSSTSAYDVFAKSDFTKGEFLINEGSQITVLIPAGFQDKPLITNDLSGGKWIDQSPIYAPPQLSENDIHSFVSQGGQINFQNGQEQLLFSFSLPLSYDHKKVRLFVNKLDPHILGNNRSRKAGNYFANAISLTDFYRGNYSIVKDIEGHVKDWRGYPMEGVNLTIGNKSSTSLYDGRFDFKNVLVDDAANFYFQKEIAAKAGITTADLIRLQQHLAGEKLFDQAYQWIAADLDNSGTVTYEDAEILMQIINEEYHTAGWCFVPSDWMNSPTKYQQIKKPFIPIFNAKRVFATEFTGVKMGDINGSFTLKPDIPTNIQPSAKALTINLLNAELKAGQNYVIPFSTNDFAELSAYQASLKVENAQITQLENTFKKHPGLTLKQLPQGVFVANWLNDQSYKSMPIKNMGDRSSHQSETAILELEIIPNRDGLLSDFITMLHNPKRTEAYDRDGKVMTIQLLFRKAPEESEEFVLYQNRPNPFRETTNINYFLPANSPVTLTLTDESGSTLKVFKENGRKGFNAFTIAGHEVTKGLIYYRLATDFGIVTKKMLHLN